MTLFMLFMLLVFFAIIGLLWCFRGFSRELRHPRKPIGYVIRLRQIELEPGQAKATAAKPGVRRATTVTQLSSAASVVSLALLLGSR